MDSNIPWEKLAKYFSGECNRNEKQEMENWFADHPEYEEQLQQLFAAWNESGYAPYMPDTDKAWNSLSSSMEKLELEKLFAQRGRERQGLHAKITQFRSSINRGEGRPDQKIRRVTGVAVAAVVLIIAGWLAYFNYSLSFADYANEPFAGQQLEAGVGERGVFTLSDGTRVVLHAESQLQVPSDYGRENRELSLVGEAYFEVNHNGENPFIVHSENVETRVLGTKFLVQAWPETDNEIVVTEGRVALSHKLLIGQSEDIVLAANQRGIAGTETIPKIFEMSESDLAWYLGWTEGRLIAQNRPLKEIIPRLERWYVLEIELNDHSIGDMTLTAEIDYSQPMSEVLAGIALSLGLEVKKENRSVTFGLKS